MWGELARLFNPSSQFSRLGILVPFDCLACVYFYVLHVLICVIFVCPIFYGYVLFVWSMYCLSCLSGPCTVCPLGVICLVCLGCFSWLPSIRYRPFLPTSYIHVASVLYMHMYFQCTVLLHVFAVLILT